MAQRAEEERRNKEAREEEVARKLRAKSGELIERDYRFYHQFPISWKE